MKPGHHKSPPPEGIIGPRVNYLSRLLRHRFNNVVNEIGLFSGQHDIILFLLENEGATVSRCAKHLGVTNATASISVKRLEHSGFLVKKADESNARNTNLYLTEKGRNVPEYIREKMDSQEKYITKGMTEEEINALSNLLDRAIQNLKEDDAND